jgi:hypothetical protein
VFATRNSHYETGVESIIEQHTHQSMKQGKPVPPLSRADAVRLYVGNYIESVISQGNYHALHDSILADLHYAAELGEEYYGKITASLGPVFDKINKTAAGDIFSWEETNHLPVITLEEVIKQKQIVYIGLDAMSNKAMSEAVGQAVIADLISLCGRLYKEAPDKTRVLNLYADEFSEIVRDEFVTLLNKAGGAGVRVTALAQTVNDIGVAFAGSPDKPKMLLGNFGTRIMMRISNLDTARVFTECLEKIRARSISPLTMSNDRPDGDNGELFTTYNTDTVTEEKTEIIVENDVFSLPKGQAFMLTNGGELYKIRIPLPDNEGDCPKTFEALLKEVNLPVSSENPERIEEPADALDAEQEKKHFRIWLQQQLDRKEPCYKPNAGKFIFTETLRYGRYTVFITIPLLEKYCLEKERDVKKMKAAFDESEVPLGKRYFVQQNGLSIDLIRINGVQCSQCSTIVVKIEEVSDGDEKKCRD